MSDRPLLWASSKVAHDDGHTRTMTAYAMSPGSKDRKSLGSPSAPRAKSPSDPRTSLQFLLPKGAATSREPTCISGRRKCSKSMEEATCAVTRED